MKPDPYADEPTVDLDPDIHGAWLEACVAAKSWQAEADRLKAKLLEQLGDAHAGLVDGFKIVTHRPTNSWAKAKLCQDHPDLTQGYFVPTTSEEFDFDWFRRVHPEIAERYRTRSFRGIANV